MPTDAPVISGTLLDRAPDGILLVHVEHHTIADVNTTFCEISGWSRDELIGRPIADLVHPEDLARKPLDPDGAMTSTVISQRRQRRRDGSLVWFETTTRATPQGYLIFVRDVSRAAADRERLETMSRLAALRSELTVTLMQQDAALPSVLQRAAAGLAELIGDACVIALADRERGLLVPSAFSHRDPIGQETLQAALTLRPLELGTGMAGKVAAEGVPARVTGLTADAVASSVPPQYRRYIDRFPVTSMLIVPLQGQGEIIGTLGLARGRAYSEDDQNMTGDFANLVGAAIEDARHDAQLRRANFLLQTVTESLPAMVSYWDSDLRNQFANEAYRTWAGMTAEEIHGRHVKDVLGAERYELNRAHLDGVLAGEPQTFDRPIVDTSGSLRHVQVTYVPDRRPDGRVAGFVALMSDVTEWSRTAAEFEYQARHDPLTGLYNRRALLDHIAAALQEVRATTGLLALFFLDLDDFKQINDRRGHQVGDAVLIAAAERIRTTIRPGDVAARLGGDEYVVLCPVHHSREADEIRTRLATALEEPVPLGEGRSVITSASVGVAVVAPDDETSPEDLLAEADRAMFRNKRRQPPVG